MLNLFFFPLLAGITGYLLGKAAHRWYIAVDPAEEMISSLLPNGQCGQCGYPGCAEAAKAMVSRQLEPNGCPLTGAALSSQIARILGIDISTDESEDTPSMVAGIDISQCDGCGRCVKQCPFDAIIGAPRQLHGIISDACTGCKQCIESCPNHCIELYPDPKLINPLPKPAMTPPRLGGAHV